MKIKHAFKPNSPLMQDFVDVLALGGDAMTFATALYLRTRGALLAYVYGSSVLVYDGNPNTGKHEFAILNKGA